MQVFELASRLSGSSGDLSPVIHFASMGNFEVEILKRRLSSCTPEQLSQPFWLSAAPVIMGAIARPFPVSPTAGVPWSPALQKDVVREIAVMLQRKTGRSWGSFPSQALSFLTPYNTHELANQVLMNQQFDDSCRHGWRRGGAGGL